MRLYIKLVYTVADPTLSHFYNSYTGTTGIQQAYMCFLMHRLAVTDRSLTPMLSLGIDFQILWKLIHMNWSVRSTTLIIPQRREPAYSNSNFSPTTCNESSRIYPFRSHSAATTHGEAVGPSFITMTTTVYDHSLSKDPQYSGLQAGQICFHVGCDWESGSKAAVETALAAAAGDLLTELRDMRSQGTSSPGGLLVPVIYETQS